MESGMTNGAGITEEALTGLGFRRRERKDANGDPLLVNGVELLTYESGFTERRFRANEYDYVERVWLVIDNNAGYWTLWVMREVGDDESARGVQCLHLINLKHLVDFLEVFHRGWTHGTAVPE